MKQRLHKSITFWFGLPVMAFICWAWRDSMRNLSAAEYWRAWAVHGASGVALGYYNTGDNDGWSGWTQPGPAQVQVVDFEEMPGSPVSVFSFEQGEVPPSTWAKPLALATKRGGSFFAPYWLILLTVAAVWMLLLFLRARRRSKSVIIP